MLGSQRIHSSNFSKGLCKIFIKSHVVVKHLLENRRWSFSNQILFIYQFPYKLRAFLFYNGIMFVIF